MRILCVGLVILVFTGASQPSRVQISMDVSEFILASDSVVAMYARDYALEKNITIDALACSLLMVMKDSRNNPQYYSVDMPYLYLKLLHHLKYPPVVPYARSLLRDTSYQSKQISLTICSFLGFGISWFHFADSIVTDTLSFTKTARNTLYFDILPTLLSYADSDRNRQDSIMQIYCNALVKEICPIKTVQIDSMLCLYGGNEYVFSWERRKTIIRFETTRMHDSLKRYPKIWQKYVVDRIRQVTAIPVEKLHSSFYYEKLIGKIK